MNYVTCPCSIAHDRLIAVYNNNKSAQSNLGRGPRCCEGLTRGGLITTVKVVAGEFITPHRLLPTLWAMPTHIAKARRSPVLKIDVAASGAAWA